MRKIIRQNTAIWAAARLRRYFKRKANQGALRLHVLCVLCLILGVGIVSWADASSTPVTSKTTKVRIAQMQAPISSRKASVTATDNAQDTEKLADEEESSSDDMKATKPSSSELHEDEARARKAAQALYDGKMDEAYRLAAQSLRRSHVYVPQAGWIAGLAAWHRGEYKLSAQVFEIAAGSTKTDPWTRSATAYWAARAHSRANSSAATVRHYLEQAAANPQTFYGILAARALGQNAAMAAQAHNLPSRQWIGSDDYTIDPALIHAIINQESQFNPRAKSEKGAQGLMQILPTTAKHVTGRSRNNLMEPRINIKIGQRYLQELLEDPSVEGDILALLAAYNAGPGNLSHWRDTMKDVDDPLLFMELIPATQTRDYIEKVMAGYWLYRYRAKLPSPSLDALIAGHAPHYPAIADWQGVTVAMQ